MTQDIENIELNIIRIGKILRACRDELEMSLSDMANQFGYKNRNFLSMIENGKSQIPIARLSDFCNIYKLDKESCFASIVLKFTQPETWDAIKHSNREIFTGSHKKVNNVDEHVEEKFLKLLKKYGVP